MTKDQVRQEAFVRRKNVTAEERQKWSLDMMANFLANVALPPAGGVIGAYMPVNNEIDPRPLMQHLIAEGYRCAIPFEITREQRLAFLSWTPETPLIPNLYDIYEPDPKYAEELVPDLIIVPGVAFDENCHRIGYGSGNFDRTFAWLDKIRAYRTVGVFYESQKFDHVPIDRHDYVLDMIVTESNVYRRTEPRKP
jgi:5-formyltetrahydrofolate cyclo-ligase